MKMKKLIALLLSLVMVAGLLPVTAMAADDAVIRINGTTATAITGTSYNCPVYIATLDAGAQEYTFQIPDGWYIRGMEWGSTCSYLPSGAIAALDNTTWFGDHDFMAAAASAGWWYGDIFFPLTAENVAAWLEDMGYGSGDDFIMEEGYEDFGDFLDDAGNGDYLTFWSWMAGGINKLTENKLSLISNKGYHSPLDWDAFDGSSFSPSTNAQYKLVYFFSNLDLLLGYDFDADDATAILLVEIPVDKSALKSALDAVPTEGYYTENDRFNGDPASAMKKNTSKPTEGFWAQMQTAKTEAQSVYNSSDASQSIVDEAYATLTDAMAKLIPTTNVNATLLYEATQVQWVWYDVYTSEIREFWGNKNYEFISADNTTTASWEPYAAALGEAAALLPTLYDAEGEPTEANTAALRPQVEALAAKVDPGKLVNKEYYSKKYNDFQTRRSDMEALLAQSDPTKLTGTYTAASLKALTDAWSALDADLKHRFAGGSYADAVMLRNYGGYFDYNLFQAIPGHYDALLAAWQGLVSDEDITVNFTYVNNFAAKYPALRGTGQDVFSWADMPLTKGHTTAKDAIDAAYIQFDRTDLRQALPGRLDNLSDTNPFYLVYVNGSYMGCNSINETSPIQLHQGDQVTVVRVCQPVFAQEASTGETSSAVYMGMTTNTLYLGESLATIAMTAPTATVKVGDKAQFSATVTGAYGTKAGQPLSPENVTLFVSEPYDDENEHYLHQPTTNTGVATDAAGKLEYVFTEPGWYMVAAFNVEDDDPTLLDMYGDMEIGTYPSLYAGDFGFVYVAPAEDPAALLAQYRSEYAATAKGYFDGFHDYDFAAGYYENTFKPLYADLTYHLSADVNLTALKAQFETDLAALKAGGATAINHQGAVDALREKLGWLPDDLTMLNSSHAALVTEIQTAYAAMNAHTRALLTPAEIARLNAVAAVDAGALPAPASVTVSIQASGSFPYNNTDTGNPYKGNPNLAWAKTPNIDGTVDDPTWFYVGNPSSLSAKAGDHVFVRRYLKPTDELYRMVWSVDGGATWTPAADQTLTTPPDAGSVAYYYQIVDYVVPADAADGSTVTLQIKMWSKAEYGANGLEAAKASALAALQAAYERYDLSKYDEDGQAALLEAYQEGVAAINGAATTDAVTAARKAATGAMAAVPKKTSGGSSSHGSFDIGSTVGSVHVLIENTTYSGGAFYKPSYGPIAEGDYPLGENDSMMTVVLRVLEGEGFGWNGTTGNLGDGGEAADYTITYLGSINKDGLSLGEFDGSNKSGWMGTLNDWFVSEGFEAFSVRNGKLENGDEIHIMFTMSLGEDIHSVWGSNNTALATMNITGGKLTPTFDGGTTDYTLIVPESGASVTVYPVPVNKNYQSRIFLNDYNKDAAQYKRTDLIAVKPGDTIYVGVGEKGWPTMNSGGKPTKYTIKVETADGAADKLDAGKVKLSNYKEYDAILKGIDRSGLSDAGKAKYDAVQARVTFYVQIDGVKTLLAALPKSATDAQVTAAKAQIEAAYAAYEKLTEEQRDYITVRDAANYNALVERLAELTPNTTAQTIVGGSGGGEKKESEGSSTTSTSNTVTAADGSQVTTETEKTVEAKTNDDGSVTETVTETTKTTVVAPDGSTSVTETAVETETTTNSVKNPDGTVTETEQTVEKVTETVTGADGKPQTTVTETSETKEIKTTTGADGKVSGTGTYSATTTVTGADGKKTTAVTEGNVAVSTDDKGTVSEVTTAKTTTTAPDGTRTETVTVITEAEMANGTTGKVVADEQGNTISAEATVSKAALEAAAKSGEPIEIPVTVNAAGGATVKISLEGAGEDGKLWVEIGTTETAPGNVAYLKLADGVTKLLTTCKTGSVIVPVTGDCEVIVKDNSKAFSDVDAGAWYGDSVKFVTAREIFNGTGDGKFAPGATMNRAMAAQILYNLDGEAKAGDGTSFSDVKASDWFNGAVGWASGLGVINGYGGAYAPLDAVTRQDLVTILYRYAKQAHYEVSAWRTVDLTAYADGAEVASYAAEAMRWAIAVGLVKGYEDNTLRPTATATRAEVAAIMQRLVQTAVK